jgi:hypothetical protein
MRTTDPAPAAEHSCERCGMRFQRRPQDSQLCLDCRERRDHARILAYGRARTWMAEQHQDLYAEVYERQVAQARAQDPDASTTKIRNRARSRTLGELARQFPGDYRQRYAAELARAHAELAQAAIRAERPAPPTPHVPYWQERDAVAKLRSHDAARVRALLWLARLYPDTTARLYQAQAARLPLNPADRTPTRRRALA